LIGYTYGLYSPIKNKSENTNRPISQIQQVQTNTKPAQLSDQQTQELLYIIEEEKLAKDVYTTIYQKR
jgi:hypothetical protein